MTPINAPAEPNVEHVRRLVLTAIASDDDLLDSLVLKGGNALRLIYRLVRRTTIDLDFSMHEDFRDAETAAFKLFGALRRKLDGAGLVLFDDTLTARPRFVPAGGNPRHGGYQARFKVIERDFDKVLRHDNAQRRKYRHRSYEIDISKYEYCTGKDRLPITPGGASIYVYTPLMIVLEKLRALCQQMPEYPFRANPTPRPEDFYDIHMVLEQTGIALGQDGQLLREIFAAKEVDTSLLTLLPTTRDFHRTQWEKVMLSASDAGGFDEHFDYVVARTARL